MTTRSAWGLGLATVTDDGNTLDVWYPRPVLGDEPEDGHADLLASLSAMERRDEARGVHTTVVRTWADLDDAPQTVAGAYLRLHTLSHRLVRPNTVNLDGIFSRLPNVVWTSAGPCRAEDFETTRMRLRAAVGRPVQVHSVDKFPRMTDYVLPSAAAPPRWACSRAAGASAWPWASAACWGRTRVSGSRWVTTASSRPACT